jgi:hypothetical protein
MVARVDAHNLNYIYNLQLLIRGTCTKNIQREPSWITYSHPLYFVFRKINLEELNGSEIGIVQSSSMTLVHK